MLSFKYISSTGAEYDLLTEERFLTECNAFDYEFTPVTFDKRYGSKIYGFEMAQKELEGTFYVFGENRKERINELIAAFDYDLQNEQIGTLVCNGYSIPAYSFAGSDSSNNSNNLLWDTFKRKFICPYPFWSKQTFEKTFDESEEDIEFEDIKDYLPVSENGTADYEWDLMTNSGKRASFINTDLTGSEWKLVIDGYASMPKIHIGNIVIELNTTALIGETITIDSRAKTIILTRENGTEINCYGDRDVSVDIFKKIPRGNIPVWWDSDYSWTLTTYDERTAPIWT